MLTIYCDSVRIVVNDGEYAIRTMTSVNLKIDPDFKSIIPPLKQEEREGLERRLLSEGCRDALVAWQGIILDGHNRFEICQDHKLPFRVTNLDFPGRQQAELWMRWNQLSRRNLTDDQRAIMADEAAELESKLEKAGRARNAANTRHGNKLCLEETPASKQRTRFKASKAAKVSEWKMRKAHGIRRKSKSLANQVKSGEITLIAAEQELKRQERDAQRRDALAADLQLDNRIIVGDWRENWGNVSDGSVSLIFTDPPYNQAAESIFVPLADFSVRKLAEGGSLVFYVGHLQLPAAFKAFENKLRHWWTCACLHQGPKALMREYGIRPAWKPMLWFVKGTRHDKTRILSDVIGGGRQKTHHDWEQPESEAEYWIDALCPADGLVCDPFIGSGTTAVAARHLNRKWIGFEIDACTAAIASQRLSS